MKTNRKPWFKKPLPLALIDLNKIRESMRANNLFDTNKIGKNDVKIETESGVDGVERRFRSYDGSHNDPSNAEMGKIFTRLGRNTEPCQETNHQDKFLKPSPREISRKLLTRDEFVPAEQLNLLAACWIQFQQHGWFSHFPDRDLGTPYCHLDPEEVLVMDLEEDDPFPEAHVELDGEWKGEIACPYAKKGQLKINRTPVDPTRPNDESDKDRPPTYLNHVSHWWDQSQLYGSSKEVCMQLRTGENGKMKLSEDDKLPYFEEGVLKDIPDAGFLDNWWLGLGLLYILFIKEHNAICDALMEKHPEFDDEELFQTARLINSALIAKIHTVEWTPGLLATDALDVAMKANWWGLKKDRRSLISTWVTSALKLKGAFSKKDRERFNEAINGILETELDHHAADFALTEEFSSVYRLHGLILDYYSLRSHQDDEEFSEKNLFEVSGKRARAVIEDNDITDLMYSFGTLYPGALRLHNFPRFLQNLYRDRGDILDLGAIDILRDRERGVPRYNDFREKIGMERVSSFEELAEKPEWAQELAEAYDNDIDMVDLFVGMYAEPLIPGFAISETAFRIFVLMASRRLKSDYFFTQGYNETNYTKLGLDWIENNSMKDVLLRHYPKLADSMSEVENAFAPWQRAGGKAYSQRG